MVKTRILIMTTEGKEIERIDLSGNFPSVRKNLGLTFSFLYTLVQEWRELTLIPSLTLALVIKLTCMQQFFASLDKAAAKQIGAWACVSMKRNLLNNVSCQWPSVVQWEGVYDQLVSSLPFSRSVMNNSLQPHETQYARPTCPLPTNGVYSISCTLSQWWHPTISSSVIPFSSYLQSFPASGSFQMSQLFASGGQSIGVSASTSVLSMNFQDWFPLKWTGWISL